MSGFFSRARTVPTNEHETFTSPPEHQTNVLADDYYPSGCMVWGGLWSSWRALREPLGSKTLHVGGFLVGEVEGVTLTRLGARAVLA
jgi:hypothetical protein